MKRLTDEGGICINCDGIAHCRADCLNKQIYDKLKHYEDLEEQEKLFILPCKINEFVSGKNGKWDGKVGEISFNSDGIFLYIHSAYNFYVKPEDIKDKF